MKNKKLIIILIALAAVGYLAYQNVKLSNRIQKIENKLGGRKRVLCNEKDSIGRARKSIVRIVGGDGEGSGFAVQKGGFILTNFHVIASEPSPKVILPGNTFEVAKIVMADSEADLAVLKINRDLPALKFARYSWISPAEELFAIGFPLGGDLSGESSVTRGSFSRSSLEKTTGVNYVFTDMTMVEGMSGGPMVNICGDVVGINTMSLGSGGMGIAVSSDSIFERCGRISASNEPLKGVMKIDFNPGKNALEAVRCFYNYLKLRNMEKAFGLLSDNFLKGYGFERWLKGYNKMMDTSVVIIKPDKKIPDRVLVKLKTKDLVDEEIVYKFFEGYWDVRQVNGRWLLWQPKIREVKEPDNDWFLDWERIKEIEAFVKKHKDAEELKFEMYDLAQEPGNEGLSAQELYKRAKK